MTTRFTHRGGRAFALAATCVVGLLPVAVFGQGRTVGDGVYSAAQATRGQALYKESCSSCHGAALDGNLAPPLSGDAFLRVWSKEPLADLVNKVQITMPDSKPGSLTRAQAADLVSYILQVAKFPAGRADLASDDASLKQIGWPAAGGAASRTAAASAAPSATLSGLPLGNLAQVMRGILFPSSNLIFNAQSQDPGAPRPAYDQSAKAGFGWADWGAGIYSGWQLVDYASISIAEAAPLLLTPGRRCENGRPVPIQNEDWIKFTNEMVEAGRAAYQASQSRNQDAVIEVTEKVSDSCLHCHEVYRDKPGGSPADPSNKAARCFK